MNEWELWNADRAFEKNPWKPSQVNPPQEQTHEEVSEDVNYDDYLASVEDTRARCQLRADNAALQAENKNLRGLLHGSLKRGAVADALKATSSLNWSIANVELLTAELENRGWSFA